MLQTPLNVLNIDIVYWTLWEELHFYLLFAIMVWRGLTYRRVVAFCLLWTVLSVCVTASGDPMFRTAVGSVTSPFFVAGVAFFLMYRFGPNALLWGIVGVSWALGLHQLRIGPSADNLRQSGPFWWPGVIVVITGIFAVMALVALGRLDWVRGRWLTIAGALTYPLYLLHGSIGYVLLARLHRHVSRWPLLIGLVAAMLVAAWLVHRFIERPLAPLVRRWLTDALAQVRRGEAIR
jgi:peptidoglycan/LPS O-acetylase OafA/YrhL